MEDLNHILCVHLKIAMQLAEESKMDLLSILLVYGLWPVEENMGHWTTEQKNGVKWLIHAACSFTKSLRVAY
jgi:hypothetical protein